MNWESQDTPHGDPGPVRVLLVEDDPGDARRIESLLRDSGDAEISLRTATSTAEAVEQLESDSVQVVLLDLGLPDGHGTETLDRILPVTGTAAVVVMTDIEDRELAEAALERGAQDFLVKGRHDAAMLVRSIRFAARRRARLVDIERLAAESRQHLSEMQSILDGSPLPMVLIDEARRVKLVNHAARDMVDTARVPGSTHLGQALGCLLCLDDPESCGNWPACASCALRTTVADTFDTLSHNRPYKDAHPVPEVIEEIRRCRGTQFDPYFFDIFVDLIPEFAKISAENQ